MCNHLTSCFCFDFHISYFKLHCLIFDDWFTKLNSFFGICNTFIDTTLCDTCCNTSHPSSCLV